MRYAVWTLVLLAALAGLAVLVKPSLLLWAWLAEGDA